MDNWFSEYYIKMFGPGNNETTYAQAADLKYNNMPKRLYKYRSFCKKHIYALEKGVLYFSSTSNQDDVKESNIVITDQAIAKWCQKSYDEIRAQYGFPGAIVSSQDDMIRIINIFFRAQSKSKNDKDFLNTPEYAEIKKKFEEFLNYQFRTMRTMYSICCFSATKQSNCMWANYADAHRGFCIEYDLKSLGEENLLTALLFPVIYVDDNRIYVDDIDQLDGNIGLLAATLKDKREWAYQQEWRLAHKLEENDTPQQMPKPTAIYLGEKAGIDDCEYMKAYCKKTCIPIFKMRYNQRRNEIEPEPDNTGT